jgi:hypothetical protein
MKSLVPTSHEEKLALVDLGRRLNENLAVWEVWLPQVIRLPFGNYSLTVAEVIAFSFIPTHGGDGSSFLVKDDCGRVVLLSEKMFHKPFDRVQPLEGKTIDLFVFPNKISARLRK